MPKKEINEEVAVDEQEMNPNDPHAREVRERAIEYADRVMAGEAPWEDEPTIDDVGEVGDGDSEPVPVSEDIGEQPALDADNPVE
jgi:hypothetical protein